MIGATTGAGITSLELGIIITLGAYGLFLVLIWLWLLITYKRGRNESSKRD